MAKPNDRHHRDRRHPGLFAVLGRIVEREKRRSILPATSRVAVNFEAAAVWREAGKVGVAGTAGLAGLPGVTRQSARRRRKFDDEKCDQKQSRGGDQRQTEPSESTPSFAHRANPCGGSEPVGGTADYTGAIQNKKEIPARLCRNANAESF
jgi:hypothetical protein